MPTGDRCYCGNTAHLGLPAETAKPVEVTFGSSTTAKDVYAGYYLY